MVAIHLGADVIERHFTVLPEDETRDGKVSITKIHLRQMAEFAAMSYDEQANYLTENVPEMAAITGQRSCILSDAEL